MDLFINEMQTSLVIGLSLVTVNLVSRFFDFHYVK